MVSELDHFGENFRIRSHSEGRMKAQTALMSTGFIGCVEVFSDDGREFYLYSRHDTPDNLSCKNHGVSYASYLSPLGQLLAKPPGYNKTVTINKIPGHPERGQISRYVEILAVAQFLSSKVGKTWDATDYELKWGRKSIKSYSARKLLDELEELLGQTAEGGEKAVIALIPDEYETAPSKTVSQVTQLPDRAILDDIQDPIFRHSLEGAVLITGAPGTGKTTVQVKRLAQKTKWTFLSQEEQSGLDHSSWEDNSNWVFFTPTTLLKNYLKEALSKEQLAASDEHVKVWSDYKLHLLRLVRFMRVEETDPTFRRAPRGAAYLLSHDSEFVGKVARDFYSFLSEGIDDRVRSALSLGPETPSPLSYLRKRRQDMPKEVRQKLTYAKLFRLIPVFYHRFRMREEYSKKYYSEGEALEKGIKEKRIDTEEMSVLLYGALRWVSETQAFFERDSSDRAQGGPSYLIGERKMIVSIDEASDFSVVDIASMSLLADPLKSSVTLSGDLMQRLTTTGLKSWEELEAFNIYTDHYQLKRAYRQTSRLAKIASKLYHEYSGDSSLPTEEIYPEHNDPHVLVEKCESPQESAEWIAARIKEIFRLSGSRLPSVGILMPDVSRIAEFAELLSSELYDAAIDVDASPRGNSLGDRNKVRVFCIDDIKGLEFESVFFCDIDKLSFEKRDIVDKLVYVGLSRSRSFLGMTYQSELPEKLSVIEEDLQFGGTFISEDTVLPWRYHISSEDIESIDEASRDLLDSYFEFYSLLMDGDFENPNERQVKFARFAQSVSAGDSPTPSDDHEKAIQEFLVHKQKDPFETAEDDFNLFG